MGTRADLSEETVTRRALLAGLAGSAGRPMAPGRSIGRAGRDDTGSPVIVSVAQEGAGGGDVDDRGFGIIGVFDVDWLLRPGFGRLLDNFAASPRAFRAVRFFGVFTAGHLETIAPEPGGNVWATPSAPIDFSTSFRALQALTDRGLVPFVVLGFFPAAVATSPIVPPPTWETWRTIVREFFAALVADPRFGGDAIREWWFEVWNEPNDDRFWRGTADDYLALYRATSDAVRESGAAVRLGGPAMAYKPEASPNAGPAWMERFLRFVAANPDVQCDFVSFHRKGTVGADEPDLRRLVDAAMETADLALGIDPRRFAGLTIVNDEADMKVGFEVPYAPRVDERFASWLGAMTVAYDDLTARYRESGLRFLAASDDANFHLVQAPFDGRRSVMTRVAPSSETDLLKLPVYGFYELAALLGDRRGVLLVGGDQCWQTTDLYLLVTVAPSRVTALASWYPGPGTTDATLKTVAFEFRDVPWSRINVARFQIDRLHSNAFTAAGGSATNPYPTPSPDAIPAIRQAQELALYEPIRHDVELSAGVFRDVFTIEPYTTLCYWLTPSMPDVPDAPRWIEAAVADGNVVLRWTPNHEPFVLGYEVYAIEDGTAGAQLTPEPLRAAMWVDTAPQPGTHVYAVRAVTTSGVAGPLVASDPVAVPPRR